MTNTKALGARTSAELVQADKRTPLDLSDSVASLGASPVLAYLAQWAPTSTTFSTMALALKQIANLCGAPTATSFAWASLTSVHVQQIRARLAEKYKPRTVNKMLAALKGVLATACDLKQISEEDYRRIVRIKGVKVQSLPSGRALTGAEIKHLLESAAPRDRALIALAYSCGLRRAEIASLRKEHYDAGKAKLRVLGKGGKERLMPVPPDFVPFVDEWWHELKAGEPFFSNGDKPLSVSGIGWVIEQVRVAAGVEHFTPHDLRRSYGTHLLDAGADLAIVSKMMGHANVATTMIYDRRGDDAKEDAASLLRIEK